MKSRITVDRIFYSQVHQRERDTAFGVMNRLIDFLVTTNFLRSDQLVLLRLSIVLRLSVSRIGSFQLGFEFKMLQVRAQGTNGNGSSCCTPLFKRRKEQEVSSGPFALTTCEQLERSDAIHLRNPREKLSNRSLRETVSCDRSNRRHSIRSKKKHWRDIERKSVKHVGVTVC